MTMQDPIADFLTRMRNAQQAGHADVSMPHSRAKADICRILQDEGYIEGYAASDDASKRQLTVRLKYHEHKPVMAEIRRVSRPGLRIYRNAKDLPSVRNGLGVAIISSSQGLMTDRAARKRGVGGEVVCTVF